MRRYLLDTNVVSEPTKPRPDPDVLRGIAKQRGECAISALTWHELWFGLGRLEPGRRRNALTAFVSLLPDQFPILDYEGGAAHRHAEFRIRDEAAGLTRPFVDSQIAAVALTNNLTVVTRNLSHFEGIDGLAVEDWHSG